MLSRVATVNRYSSEYLHSPSTLFPDVILDGQTQIVPNIAQLLALHHRENENIAFRKYRGAGDLSLFKNGGEELISIRTHLAKRLVYACFYSVAVYVRNRTLVHCSSCIEYFCEHGSMSLPEIEKRCKEGREGGRGEGYREKKQMDRWFTHLS